MKPPRLSSACACVLLFAVPAQAQTMFMESQQRARENFVPARGDVDYAIGDVDGDGIQDVVLVNSGRPHVYRRSGQGWIRQLLSTGYDDLEFRLVDLDGDGDLDLLAVPEDQTPRNYLQMLANANGRFAASPFVTLPGTWNARSMAAADFDGDGDADLAIGRFTASFVQSVSLMRNNGGLTLLAPQPTPLGDGWRIALAAGDVDGDGDPDCVATSQFAAPVLLRNDGTGTFTEDPAALPPWPAGRWDYERLHCADLDGDGRDDVVMVALHGVTDLLWGAAGTLVLQQDVVRGTSRGRVEPADIDGDGDGDLVAHRWEGFDVLRHDGARGFGFEHGFTQPGTVVSTGIGDFNSDGRADVLVSMATWPDHGRVLYGDRFVEDAAFRQGFELTVSPLYSRAPLIGDVDRDGRTDTLLTRTSEMQIQLARGGGSYERRASPLPASGWTDLGPQWLLDLDGDRVPEIVVADENGLAVYRDGGGLQYQRTAHFPGECEPRSVTFGDIDGDGDVDIVNCVTHGHGFVAIRNLGGGAFSGPGLIATPVWAAELADLDGDGDLDLATSLPIAGGHELLANDGTGTFAPAPHLRASFGFTVQDIAAGDVDGDGDVDLLASQWGLGGHDCDLVLLRNDGRGTFQAPQTLFRGNPCPEMLLEDFDEDGDLDVFAGQALLVNDGTGSFANLAGRWGHPTRPSRQWDRAYEMSAGDLDDDGDLDVVFGGPSWRTQTDWGIAVNHTRQLVSVHAPRVGGQVTLDVYSGPGYGPTGVYGLLGSLAAGPVAWAVPGVAGKFQLDLNTTRLMHIAPTGPPGVSRAFIPVPPLTTMVGVEFHFQALWLPTGNGGRAGFTNPVFEVLLP